MIYSFDKSTPIDYLPIKTVIIINSHIFLLFLTGTFNFGYRTNRSAPKLLCGATSIVLLIGPILWIVTSSIFLFGGFSDKLICQTLQGKPHAETVLYDFINEAMNDFIRSSMNNIPLGDKVNGTFKYDNLINSCNENQGLLEVFNIEINYQEYLNQYDEFNTSEIKDKLKEMVNQGINGAASSLVIDPDTKDNINQIIDKFSAFAFPSQF